MLASGRRDLDPHAVLNPGVLLLRTTDHGPRNPDSSLCRPPATGHRPRLVRSRTTDHGPRTTDGGAG